MQGQQEAELHTLEYLRFISASAFTHTVKIPVSFITWQHGFSLFSFNLIHKKVTKWDYTHLANITMHQNPVTTVVAVHALREENHRKANHCIPHVNGERG